jgi:hypothetical protein
MGYALVVNVNSRHPRTGGNLFSILRTIMYPSGRYVNSHTVRHLTFTYQDKSKTPQTERLKFVVERKNSP